MIPLSDDNPQLKTPWVTYALIFANGFCWAFIQNFGRASYCEFGLIPEIIFGLAASNNCSSESLGYLSLITYAFLHADWIHLSFNLWFLFVFGNNVEDIMGPRNFLLFYLFSAVASGLCFVLSAGSYTIPLVGASGAISAILAVYLFTYPRVKVLTFVPLGISYFVLRLSSWFIIGYWVILDLIHFGIFQDESSPVAYSAHVGGFIFGTFVRRLFVNEKLVGLHQYAGWDAQISDLKSKIPQPLIILNYCMAFGGVIVLVIYAIPP